MRLYILKIECNADRSTWITHITTNRDIIKHFDVGNLNRGDKILIEIWDNSHEELEYISEINITRQYRRKSKMKGVNINHE